MVDIKIDNKSFLKQVESDLNERLNRGEEIHYYDVLAHLGLMHEAELVRRGIKPDFIWKKEEENKKATITIFDYKGTPKEVDIDLNDPKYLAAYIQVLTGDEVLHLIGHDGIDIEEYDSSCDRIRDCYDGRIILKRGGKLTDEYLSEDFQTRGCAYDYLWKVID